MRKKYLIYARVSPHGSTNTSAETSIGAQLEECRRFVLQRDPDAEFLEETDEFKSGKSLTRPAMQRILTSIKQGTNTFDTVVVWHLDRLSRSIADAAPLFELFREKNIGLICVRQGWDMTTASGRLMLYFFVLIAQYEREMCSDRTRTKMMSIAEQGKVPYGKLPYGFRRDAQNNLRVCDEEMQIVREIFTEVAEGRFSYLDFKAKHPDFPLSKSRCYGLLRNRLYVGVLEYGGREVNVPTGEVVPRDLFQRAQDAAKANSRRGGNEYAPRRVASAPPRPLAGKLFCKCGCHLTPYSVVKGSGKRYRYYKCTSPACKTAVPAERLEDEIFAACKALATDESILREAWREWLKAMGDERSREVAQLPELRERLNAEREREKRLADAFADGLVSKANAALMNARLEECARNVAELEAAITGIEEREKAALEADADFEAMRKEFATYADALDGENETEARLLLADLLIERVTMRDDGTFRVELCVSPDGVANSRELDITFEVALPRPMRSTAKANAVERKRGFPERVAVRI